MFTDNEEEKIANVIVTLTVIIVLTFLGIGVLILETLVRV